jgi:hypothetical protein
MPRKPEPLEPWMLEAIQLMIRQNLSLRQAASQLGVEITPQEADNVAGRVRFQEALEEARLAYYTEIGSNPRLTKEAVVGQIYKLASKLTEDREDYKASDALLKLSKIKGWVGYEPDSLYKTLSVLSAKELDEVREHLKQQQRSQQPQPAENTPAETKADSKLVN